MNLGARRIVEGAGLGVLFLFFFQLLSGFIESVYAFGLLNVDIPIEIISVLFLLSPLLMVIVPRLFSRPLLIIVGELVLLSRLLEPLLDTRGRMLAAGFGVSCFLLFFPGYLQNRGRRADMKSAGTAELGLILALALSIFFRSLYSSIDVSTRGWTQIIGLALAIIAAVAIPKLVRKDAADSAIQANRENDLNHDNNQTAKQRANLGKIVGISLGISAALVLLYFSFSTPAVVSRWTGAGYFLVVALSMIVLLVFGSSVAFRPDFLAKMSRRLVILLNILFAATLGLTIWLHQVDFPTNPNLYPVEEAAVGPWHWLALILTILLFPVILLDFGLLVGETINSRPSLRAVGLGFTASSLLLLVLIFANVFTTTYDYIPVIGPAFRDRYWLIYLAAALVLILSILLVKRSAWVSIDDEPERSLLYLPAALLVLTLATGAAIIAGQADPAEEAASNSIRLLTYNIQQGYDANGLRGYQEQLDLIKQLDPHIIGLQESDTSRIAGGNNDVVRFLADNLDMYSYYGPKTVNGTFGIALLSKYPIKDPQTYYLFSEGEQVAVIEAAVEIGDEELKLYVNHFGNGGPLIQTEQFLSLVADGQKIVAMGDYNFDMDSEQYQITRSVLPDSWWLRWPQGIDDTGLYPEKKVDHIFVSPAMQVEGARFIEDSASDHPAVTAVIRITE